ncbi:inositol monophosphatase family protein [Kaistia dalseonensis]|uniref:Fructose-1,6-bisphosphatase/inositol monophosphatase family enzyme n=1 Tax=Kaistia dalseonensis TaxID=410840 RepID=A0ABU0H0G5_9HYPH|nr:inositol monophosphatase family protein [Kaistia dalseonensis]MCX5493241.1 inositol monophosphatase family protein [Kaistia dalseonensis]MDQ0435796.1 fructose-1,6-bisphosphatase/inositol monophosphatase family enzyme [Kaistia dalseonensis]
MSFTVRDAQTVAEILREAARTEIMPRFRHLSAGAIRQKSSAEDLVTDADEAAEKVIAAALRTAFPGAIIIGEEGVAARPALLDELDGAELAFSVDPVDGTKNFASGLPLFGTMAGVIVRGEIVAGIILDPVGGDWTIGVRGEGSWTENPEGVRIDLKVEEPLAVNKMSGTASWSTLPEPLRSTLCANLARSRSAANYRCAAHEYRLISGGFSHFALFSKINLWDHAAGWIIHKEAGGYSARFDGSPYLPGHRDGGLLYAPDKASWEALQAAFFKGTEYGA